MDWPMDGPISGQTNQWKDTTSYRVAFLNQTLECFKNFGRLYARDGNWKSANLSHLNVKAISACVQPANGIKNIIASVLRDITLDYHKALYKRIPSWMVLFSVLASDSHPRIALFLKTSVYRQNMQIDRQIDWQTKERQSWAYITH